MFAEGAAPLRMRTSSLSCSTSALKLFVVKRRASTATLNKLIVCSRSALTRFKPSMFRSFSLDYPRTIVNLREIAAISSA